MTNECVFCARLDLDVLAENVLAFAIRDKFPVRHLHTLIIPKRHVADSFDLTSEEFNSLFDLARKMRNDILDEDRTVGGFNFGSNNGLLAGQKIPHTHFHLIPRRAGEEPPPHAKA